MIINESAEIPQDAYDNLDLKRTYKRWVDNEYREWAKALSESTVHNFKQHPMVRRMLSFGSDHLDFEQYYKACWPKDLLHKIEGIGYKDGAACHFGLLGRMIYYAQQILFRNPSSICEIGGGVGEFYAILRALGYKGAYRILDMAEVAVFQRKYLKEVAFQTGLFTEQDFTQPMELLVSFYALGEFSDDLKRYYQGTINAAPHGYIAWNPHSGATDDLSIFKNHKYKTTPGIEPGVKIITW